MSERDVQVNRALHALDQAHRLGSLARSDYRSRRRELLQRLQQANEITARNTLRRDALVAVVPPMPILPSPPMTRQRSGHRTRAAVAWRYLLILAVLLLAGGLLLFWLMSEN
jgi:hypothetical protein